MSSISPSSRKLLNDDVDVRLLTERELLAYRGDLELVRCSGVAGVDEGAVAAGVNAAGDSTGPEVATPK